MNRILAGATALVFALTPISSQAANYGPGAASTFLPADRSSDVSASPSGMPRTLSARAGDVYNVLEYCPAPGACGTGTATPLSAVLPAGSLTSLTTLAAVTAPNGSHPYAWVANDKLGLTFQMQATATPVGPTLSFLQPKTNSDTSGHWTGTVAAWQWPLHGNFILAPGMTVVDVTNPACLPASANATVSAIGRIPGLFGAAVAGYGTVTSSVAVGSGCGAADFFRFTVSSAQIAALTTDYLAIQTGMALPILANGETGSGRVYVPSANYVLNHGLLDASDHGTAQGLDFGGDNLTGTILTWVVDLGVDGAAIKAGSREQNSINASNWHDMTINAPSGGGATLGAFGNNGMSGFASGKNAALRNLTGSYFKYLLNVINDHFNIYNLSDGNGNGCTLEFGDFSAATGNYKFEDSNLSGGRVASICVSSTNQMDAGSGTNTHVGYGPFGILKEPQMANITSANTGLISNSTLQLWIEGLGIGFISGPGGVDSNVFIGGVSSYYAFETPPGKAVTSFIDAGNFDNNTMIGTFWAPYATLSGGQSVINMLGECYNNVWINDYNFIYGQSQNPSVSMLSCGNGTKSNRWTGALGEAVIVQTGAALTAMEPTYQQGAVALPYVDGQPFLGVPYGAVAANKYTAIFTNLMDGLYAPKANSAVATPVGPLYPTSTPAVGWAPASDQNGAAANALQSSPAGSATINAITINAAYAGGGRSAASTYMARKAFLDTSLSSSGFTPSTDAVVFVPLSVVASDTNGNYNTSTGLYTVPYSGTYQLISKLRITDGSPAGVSYGLGVDVAGGSGAPIQWFVTTGTTLRNSSFNIQAAHFTAGQQIGLFVYEASSNSMGVQTAQMTISLQAAD